MILALRMSLLAIGLASLLGSGAASAGPLVEFLNLQGYEPARLNGYLARPDIGYAGALGAEHGNHAPYPPTAAILAAPKLPELHSRGAAPAAGAADRPSSA